MLPLDLVLSLPRPPVHVYDRERVTIARHAGDRVESKTTERVPRRAGEMVRRPAARSALAARPRSLSRLDLGDHAAADARCRCDSVLSTLSAPLSHGAAPGSRAGGFGVGSLERSE